MLLGESQLRLLVSVPSKPMRSRPLELPWLPSTLLPVPAPRPRVMLKRRIAGCGWRESAGVARPLFLTVLPVRVSDPGVAVLGLDRLMPDVAAPWLVAPLKMEKAVCGNLIVVPVRAPLPRRVVVKSWVKLRLPQSPATGVPQVVMKTEGQSARPTVLSRIVVIVAPPAMASSVAPWKVSVPKDFSTAAAGRVSVFPLVTVRPLRMT